MKPLLLAAALFATLVGTVALAVPLPTTTAHESSAQAQEKLVGVVYFAVDSDELDAAAKKVLEPLVERALADPKNVLVSVRGHSEKNEAGNGAEYGIGLSQRRAANVSGLFYPKDLGASRPTITTEAFGETRPPAKGGNARRVEVYFGKGAGW
jgi:outer membrane protein OmpA-like peptidoglycan-associated protein